MLKVGTPPPLVYFMDFLLRQSDGNTNFISTDFFTNTNFFKDYFV